MAVTGCNGLDDEFFAGIHFSFSTWKWLLAGFPFLGGIWESMYTRGGVLDKQRERHLMPSLTVDATYARCFCRHRSSGS